MHDKVEMQKMSRASAVLFQTKQCMYKQKQHNFMEGAERHLSLWHAIGMHAAWLLPEYFLLANARPAKSLTIA